MGLVFRGWIRQHAHIIIRLRSGSPAGAVAGRKASQVDLRFEREFLVVTHDLVQGIGMEAVHRRLAVLSVHQAGELFQLVQDVRLEVPFLTELRERFMKRGVLRQLFQGSHLPSST